MTVCSCLDSSNLCLNAIKMLSGLFDAVFHLHEYKRHKLQFIVHTL